MTPEEWERCVEHARKVAAEFPPPTPEQVTKLRHLFGTDRPLTRHAA